MVFFSVSTSGITKGISLIILELTAVAIEEVLPSEYKNNRFAKILDNMHNKLNMFIMQN